MKILFVTGFYPEIGGPFTVFLNLLLKLSEKNIDVKVISPIPKGYEIDKLSFISELPFKVIYIREQLPRNIAPSFSLEFFDCIKQESKHVDLIYLAGIFDLYSIPVYLSGKPYIYGLHGTFMKGAFEGSIFKRIKKTIFMKTIGRKILENATKIHCVSHEEWIHFLEYFPELENKVVLIPNGINIMDCCSEYYKNNPIKRVNSRQEKMLLFLGRIHPIKGLDILIQAFSKLRKEKRDVRLIIAGRDDGDGYEKVVREWVRTYGLEEVVSLVGFITGEEKIKLICSVDALILPSYSEGLPTAVIEAMNCYVPVIVSDRVGMCREIKDRKAGILIGPTVEGVYNGLKTWLNMKESELKEMVLRAKSMIDELYDIEKVVDKMIKLFEEAIKHGS